MAFVLDVSAASARPPVTTQTTAFLRRLTGLPIQLDRSPDESAILALARKHRLSVYDAAYLELAGREKLSLATLDQAVARAAAAENRPLIGADAAH